MQDIIDNVQAIQRYVTGMDLASFEEDARTNDAVERCLERISEAAAKLGDIAPTIMPDQPWQQIRGLGNRLRHEYDAIRADRLWDIVRIDLPALSSACEHALRQLREMQPE
ncbi:MAG: HepT-like ribonuclease domain-containing protein [Bryobacteraceae bacterium]